MKANEFKAWRARVGLTQRQIADRLEVTRQTIQNWESAASPIPQAVDIRIGAIITESLFLGVRRSDSAVSDSQPAG
jgi:DNA-binding XRE family transcriptional regulator